MHENAPSAETLMRSRYTAYTLADIAYIKKTMREKSVEAVDQSIHWLGLNIIKTTKKTEYHVFVEFIAKYKKLDNTKDTKYTYNIDNIDIRKDTIGNNEENKLGNSNLCLHDPELDEIYNTSLRGDDKYKNIDDEIFNYSIKPNKTDLPIVNAPMHLLLNGAPLRLSERHLL